MLILNFQVVPKYNYRYSYKRNTERGRQWENRAEKGTAKKLKKTEEVKKDSPGAKGQWPYSILIFGILAFITVRE